MKCACSPKWTVHSQYLEHTFLFSGTETNNICWQVMSLLVGRCSEPNPHRRVMSGPRQMMHLADRADSDMGTGWQWHGDCQMVTWGLADSYMGSGRQWHGDWQTVTWGLADSDTGTVRQWHGDWQTVTCGLADSDMGTGRQWHGDRLTVTWRLADSDTATLSLINFNSWARSRGNPAWHTELYTMQ